MTKLLALISMTLFSLSALANLHLAPPSFDYKDGKAVFMDITEGTYDIKYFPSKLSSSVKTTWKVNLAQEGYPLFDFVPSRIGIKVNGQWARFSSVDSPDGVTSYRVINTKLKAGSHTIELYTKVKRGTTYGYKSVNSGFFIKDLSEKKFLEKYVPANLEYDQYPITFNVKIYSSYKHKVIANGSIVETGWNAYTVKYPSWYSSSSVYFHTFKKGKYWWIYKEFKSISGETIPVTIYTKWFLNADKFLAKTQKVFHELEADYGAYPHKHLIIYGMALRGGMEYPGATATSLVSLGHEMFHFYFAKSVIPANGNSGWMDEGLASWRDKGYQTLNAPTHGAFNLGNHSLYKRNTDDNSYKVGRGFFAFLNSKVNLKALLRDYFSEYKNSLVTTDSMINFFEGQTGQSLRGDFDQYVLNSSFSSKRANYVEKEADENLHHIDYTQEELDEIL